MKNKIRIVSWNCHKGLTSSKKRAFLHGLKADIIVLQEALKADLPEIKNRIWQTNRPDKKGALGLGIYILNDAITCAAQKANQDFEIYQPLKITKDKLTFDLMAVWAFNKRSVGRYKGERGVILDALSHYGQSLHKRACWIGDFNNGPEIQKGKYWSPALETFQASSMEPVVFSGQRSTHKHSLGKSYEIDHCMLGSELLRHALPASRLKLSNVPSDHVPLVFDLEIG